MPAEHVVATQWVKGILRAEMAKKGLTYAELAVRLRAIGVEEDEKNLANKIGRGTFSATLFLQCLSAMGLKELSFEPWGKYKYVTPQEEVDLDMQNLAPFELPQNRVPGTDWRPPGGLPRKK